MSETEKYGVEEEDDATKTAADSAKKCPRCGGALRPREVTGILLCVKCGTQPFEVQDHGSKKHR